jgi:hypothetical protein
VPSSKLTVPLETGEYAEDLAASMLATILGVKFDPDESYDKKKEVWKWANGRILWFLMPI